MRIVSEEELKAQRAEYTDMLRKVADDIDHSEDRPTAMLVQVYWKSGTLTRLKKVDQGADLLRLIGGTDCVKASIIEEVFRG